MPLRLCPCSTALSLAPSWPILSPAARRLFSSICRGDVVTHDKLRAVLLIGGGVAWGLDAALLQLGDLRVSRVGVDQDSVAYQLRPCPGERSSARDHVQDDFFRRPRRPCWPAFAPPAVVADDVASTGEASTTLPLSSHRLPLEPDDRDGLHGGRSGNRWDPGRGGFSGEGNVRGCGASRVNGARGASAFRVDSLEARGDCPDEEGPRGPVQDAY